jgi:nucleotide-binding universal stress UspA family protein
MYRDILVHMKSYELWSPHIDFALAMAARSSAFLTGLLTNQNIALLKLISVGPGGGAALIGGLQEQADQRAEALRTRFEQALKTHNIQGAFEAAEGRADELIAMLGRFHDLIIVEQTAPGHDEINLTSTEEAAVQSGRPTLIVPHRGKFQPPFKRLLVAWNGSREATRALHGALPLIEAAESVVLLEGHPREVSASITKAPSTDIASYLKRHARAVESAGKDLRDAGAASAIPAVAEAKDCDLIVMGAYGRAGISRLLFGGATAKVFADMRLPVLAAH